MSDENWGEDVVSNLSANMKSATVSGSGAEESSKRRGGGAGGGGIPRSCFKCGQEGHMSRECPSASGGTSGGGRSCFKCGQEGHMSRECPSASGGASVGGRSCFKCGQKGHMSRECPSAAGGGGGGGADGKNSEERPKPYVPEPELEGDAAFEDRKNTYEGCGINFSKYEDIKFEITGDNKQPSLNSFENMELEPIIYKNIVKIGYTTPTPIQRHASPQLMAGLDVMACAQTGSGKTASFLLPMINTLIANANLLNSELKPVKPECVILAPTRELAIQINREARLYSQNSVVKSVVCYGGAANFAQREQLQNGCNIIVATPGRLLQFVNEQVVNLELVQYFILDEADRMLDLGFMGVVKQLLDTMPPPDLRVSGMFSATFPIGVQKAAAMFLRPTYIFVVIGVVGGACTDVVQEFRCVDPPEKRANMVEIINEAPKDAKVLIFCNAKKAADFLAVSLSCKGIPSTSIHGDRMQSQRELALKQFIHGNKKVLVATAVAARGLDIPKVSIVINYDLPNEIEEYVHRIGRTGRLGHTGRAVSFYYEPYDKALVPHLVTILKDANQKVPDFFTSRGYGGGASNQFSSTDYRNRAPASGAPKPVEKEEEVWG